MRFGLSFLPDATPDTKSATAYFADALALSEMADQEGLHTVKMTEHYLQPYGGYCPNPLAFLASVATRTRRVRLMTGGILPAFHHPIQIAAEAAMVDAISGGRLDIGFARAYLPYEFDAFGVSLDESRERYSETIRTVIRLWTESRVTVNTPFFAFRNVRSLPQPVQQPHPPIWGAAVRSRQSFAWLGQQGFNLLVTPGPEPLDKLAERIAIYGETFAETQGHADKRPQVAISLPLFLAENDQQAMIEGERYLQRYYDVWAQAADSWTRVVSRDYPGYTGLGGAIRKFTPRVMRESGKALLGCPERAIDGIRQLYETLHVDQILWQLDFGAMPMAAASRTLKLFIDRVLGRL